MNVDALLAEIKALPGFAEHVGMLLVHNGVVRGWSRAGHKAVGAVSIRLDRERLEAIRREVESRPGIFAARAEGREGRFLPGDDILLLVTLGSCSWWPGTCAKTCAPPWRNFWSAPRARPSPRRSTRPRSFPRTSRRARSWGACRALARWPP